MTFDPQDGAMPPPPRLAPQRMLVVVGGVISLIFLWWAIGDLQWGDVAAALRQVDGRWLVPAAALILADYGFRALRWGMILYPVAGHRLGLRLLLPVLLIGFAANNVIPARAGELWRMWGLSRQTGIRKTVTLSTLVVERVFDGLTLLLLLAIASYAHPLQGELRAVQVVLTALFGAVLAGLLLLLFFETWTIRLATRLMWPVPHTLRERLVALLGRFTDGLRALRHPRALTAIILTSLLAWGSQGLSFAAILLAFNLRLAPAELVTVGILMLAVINIVIMIPAGPGNVGTFEGAGRVALTIAALGLSDGEIAAVVAVTHVLQWLLVTSLGLLFAARAGVTLAGLTRTPELEPRRREPPTI